MYRTRAIKENTGNQRTIRVFFIWSSAGTGTIRVFSQFLGTKWNWAELNGTKCHCSFWGRSVPMIYIMEETRLRCNTEYQIHLVPLNSTQFHLVPPSSQELQFHENSLLSRILVFSTFPIFPVFLTFRPKSGCLSPHILVKEEKKLLKKLKRKKEIKKESRKEMREKTSSIFFLPQLNLRGSTWVDISTNISDISANLSVFLEVLSFRYQRKFDHHDWPISQVGEVRDKHNVHFP